MTRTRRAFLADALCAGTAVLVGCPAAMDDDGNLIDDDGNALCPDPFAGGEYLGEVAFTAEPAVEFGTLSGVGWDARRRFDLSRLDGAGPAVPNPLFYVRTGYPDLLETGLDDWTIRVHGLVAAERVLALPDLLDRVVPAGKILMECSGNTYHGQFGLMSTAHWAGIPLLDLLDDEVDVSSGATRVRISGFDEHSVPSEGGHSWPGASWVFTFDDLAEAWLVTEMNGEPLPRHNGFPVRLLIPGWYGCACIKWVDDIELVDEDAQATAQMQEFATRTHQDYPWYWARDYLPARIDTAAMPVRVEKWRVDGEIAYRIVGILWGGEAPTDKLIIGFDGRESPVDVCPTPSDHRAWSLWSHRWTPSDTGTFMITLRIDDEDVSTRRLDIGWYDRMVDIDEI